MEKKPHYFELTMTSVSEGVINQEVVLVREYASTPSELVLKQMTFTKDAGPDLLAAVTNAMDKQSMPWQEQGAAEALEAFGSGKPGNPNKP